MGGIWTLTIARAFRNNALTPVLCEELRLAFDAVAQAPDARVVVLQGIDERAFCAGFDIGALQPGDRQAVEQGNTQLYAALDAVTACPVPVVASIAGFAMGAGLELACACDLRVMADTAVFAMSAARLGVLYRWEGFVRILSMVGPANAAEVFLLGRRLDATRAREMGLVNWVVPAAERERFTADLAADIAENAPLSVRGAKAMLGRLKGVLAHVVHDDLDELVRRARASEDFKEGQRAFLQKRKPKFVGR